MNNDSAVQTEHVMVVPTQLFHDLGYFQGFCDDISRYRTALLDPQNTRYRPRHEVEVDPGYKQLIPYVLFRYRVDGGAVQIFQYTRGSGQGESRLHRLRSVGVGGHISADDDQNDQPYDVGMQREIAEELIIQCGYDGSCVGLINDDSNEVGRVHLGIVHLMDVTDRAIRPRERDLIDSGFCDLNELIERIDQFETWSQICLRWLQRASI